MPKILKSNIGYNGGSPRIQHKVLKAQPKVYGESDINDYILKIKQNYLNHNFSKEDLIYLNNYLSILITDQDYYGEENNSKLIFHFIMILETLYTDDKINKIYIQSCINKIDDIITNIIPPTIIPKSIKTEETVNTLNKYDGSIINITKEKPSQTPSDKSVSPIDIKSIVNVINKYYLEDIIVKEQIENLNNSFKVLNGDSIELNILPNFLKKINILVSNAFTDGRLSQNKLLSLISKVNIILDNEKPIKIKPKKIIKNHISNLAPGYKK